MSLTEFAIIENYFHQHKGRSPNVMVGIGDDAAVITIPKDKQLVTTVDTLVEGVHFFSDIAPRDLGHKALAVNLSDIAAMGASPDTALLAVTLKKADKSWLAAFSEGFFSLADRYNVTLIGGDVTAGPLCVSVIVNGLVPKGKAICRRGAKAGDLVYVTGTIGEAGLALDLLKQQKKMDSFLLNRLNRPTPRIEAGLALRDIASAAIDISDGLVADLEKITMSSQVSAKIHTDQLPLSKSLQECCDEKTAWQYALTAGDDYELCFTIPAEKKDQLEKAFRTLDCKVHCIGEIVTGSGVSVVDSKNNSVTITKKGYEHFSKTK